MIVPSSLPIVQAPMAGGPSTPELAAAVAVAGGFGTVAGGYLTVRALDSVLARTRQLTTLPVGVNLFVPSPPDADDAALARYVAELAPEADRLGVPLGDPTWDDDDFPAKLDLLTRSGLRDVSLTFGCPHGDVVRRLHAAGLRVTVTVTDAPQAEHALSCGADGLITQGTEAGGHQGGTPAERPNTTTLLELVRAVAPLGAPVIATGGIADGEGVRAALDAGAEAVQVGTAFLCTEEAGTSAPHRRALLAQLYERTLLTRAFSGRWARGLANRFARDHPDAPAGYPQLHHVTRPLRAAAAKRDDADVPNLWAGTSWRDVSTGTARDVVRRLAVGL